MVLDVCVGKKPPFSPSEVVQEYSDLLKAYKCFSVVGDRYAGEWPVEAFAKVGIAYQHSAWTKSELYLESLPLFTCGVVDLIDSQPLRLELQGLERRTGKGRDSVDHGPNGHDDFANACCGALVLAHAQDRQQGRMVPLLEGWAGEPDAGEADIYISSSGRVFDIE